MIKKFLNKELCNFRNFVTVGIPVIRKCVIRNFVFRTLYLYPVPVRYCILQFMTDSVGVRYSQSNTLNSPNFSAKSKKILKL
jgi:hypothetical protein